MKVHLGASLLLALFLWGCQPAAGPAAPKPSITVQWDLQTTTFTTARTTVRDVLQDLGIQLGTLDRVAPGEVAVLSDGMLYLWEYRLRDLADRVHEIRTELADVAS